MYQLKGYKLLLLLSPCILKDNGYSTTVNHTEKKKKHLKNLLLCDTNCVPQLSSFGPNSLKLKNLSNKDLPSICCVINGGLSGSNIGWEGDLDGCFQFSSKSFFLSTEVKIIN